MADPAHVPRRHADPAPPSGQGRGDIYSHFAPRVLVVVGAAIALFVLWRVSDIVMLVFGALLLATALRAIADVIERNTPLPMGAAFAGAVLLIVALIGVAGFLLGDTLVAQFEALSERIPGAIEQVRAWLRGNAFGRAVVGTMSSVDGAATAARIAGFAATAAGGLTNLLLVLILAVYFAADPGLYRRGFLRLVPEPARPRIASTISACARALRMWLMGQGLAMLAVALVTWIGLWFLGVPYAIALAVIAGLLDFIPFLGPILAAVPAILVAFTESPTLAAYVALLYLAIQQIEGNLLVPLIQRWAVSLPPALAVIAIIVFGLLFGIPGILFAVPLMVVVTVLVEKLYVEALIRRD